MDDQSLQSVFQILSKAVIGIPIGIVIIALIIKYTTTRPYPTADSMLHVPTPVQQKNSIKVSRELLALDGPFHCIYSSPAATGEAFILHQKIFAAYKTQHQTENYLFDTDCLYMWNAGSFAGNKICGLENYIGLFKTIAQMQGGDIEPMLSQVSGFIPSATKSGDIVKLVNSCKKAVIKEPNLFKIPKSILFKNGDITKKYPGYDLFSPTPLWSEYHRR